MPYDSNSSLPQAVKDKIKSPKRRRQWRHVFNSELSRQGGESCAFAGAWSTVQKGIMMPEAVTVPNGEEFHFFLPISKIDKENKTVSGYASTERLDLDGEIVSLDAVKKALPSYWEWRNIREMHQPSAVGRGQEYNVDGKGLFLTSKITDPTAWQKCLDEVYQGYSIGGRKLAKNGNKITEIELIEVSLVDRPANPDCKIEVMKSAKPVVGGEAELVKASSPRPRRNPQAKAIDHLSKAVRTLAKAGDGHVHEIDGVTGPPIEPKTEKREFSEDQRQSLASSGKALPDGSFPIANEQDLRNAIQAIGRAKDPGAARSHIKRRAKALGASNLIPDGWGKISKKEAKKASKLAKREREASMSSLELTPPLPSSAQPSFLTLSAKGGGIGPDHEGFQKSVHGLDEGRPASRKDGNEDEFDLFSLTKRQRKELAAVIGLKANANDFDGQPFYKDNDMSEARVHDDPLTKMIYDVVKASRQPSRAQRLSMAGSDVKKARKAMKECAAAIEAVHKLHKAAYLSKAAKKDGASSSEFDHEGAMKELQKAYGSLRMARDMGKSAGVQLKKAATRVGERGQEATDPDEPFYTVPAGVKDLSPEELSTAGPGGTERGSQPEIWSLEGNHKVAKPDKVGKGLITEAHAQALARAAAAEAQVEILGKMPLGGGGRRPAAFDLAKIGVSSDAASSVFGFPVDEAKVMFKGVNPHDLASDDEERRKSAVGKAIGQRILGGMGKSVFDPAFHGTAGASRE